MKKILPAIFFLFAVLANDAFGQTDTSLLSLNDYAGYFGFQGGRIDITSNYIAAAPRSERRTYAGLGGDELFVDTPLEFALLSYYSPPVIQIRPAEADAMLPANNPKQADLKLGAAVFQEIQILRFLGNTAAVGRHEGMLKFIADRGNATRPEVETFYRSGIRGLISATVDEEFNKVSFLLVCSNKDHNAVLTRNAQTGHYTLSYGGAYTNNEIREIKDMPLDTLRAEMVLRRSDFDQTGINQVRAQAALIPAVARLADMNRIVNAIVTFYTSPSTGTFDELNKIYSGYRIQNLQERAARDSFMATLYSLNLELNSRIGRN